MPDDVQQASPGPDEAAFQLAGFLRERRGEIIERWVEATRAEASIRDLDERHLIDHLPVILDEIAEAMEAKGKRVEPPEGGGPAAHGREREQVGFTLQELVSEFRLLRRCLLSLCRACVAHLLPNTVEDVNEAIDRAVERSVARFTHARGQALQSLDQLAELAPAGASLDELLASLLRALVARVRAVDGASLLLREGDLLRLRATAGLAEERGAFTLPLGEGFAGAVAARREPLLAPSAATDPRVRSDLYRKAGVQALYGVPLIDFDGQAIGVVTVASLTERDFSDEDKLLMRTLTRRATALIVQHLLREQAEAHARRLRHADSLMAVHPDSFSVVDREHRVVWANPALLNRWGRRLEEAAGRPLREMGYSPRVAAAVHEELERVLRRGETIQNVAAFPYTGDDRRVFEYVMAPIRGEGGEVEEVAIVTRDVSDRFLAERERADALVRERSSREEAEQTVALLDSLLAASPAGIAFIDPELRYVRINEALAGVSGRPVGEHIGRHPREVLPEAGRLLEPPIRRVLQTGASIVNHELECPPPSAPGELRAFLGNFFPVRAPSGGITGVGVVCVEITDRKKVEEELRRAVTIRERVMSILSHDLRGPLSVVSAGAAMLRRSPELGEQELRTVARITRASDRMARMIRDLLDYARATGGGLPIDRKPANLRALASNALDEMRAAFPGAQLHLEADGGECYGEWDPDRIAQLLTNLLSNAVQYSPPGGPVTLRVGGAGPCAIVEVHNGGAPIPAEALPALFEPFHRSAASDAASPGGLGLGLFIVKQIAEGHGGTVAVRSTVAGGTTFTVRLPRA